MRKPKPTLLTVLNNKSIEWTRRLNSFQRALPDFIIIGAAKGGTTSLFNYLVQHPQIVGPYRKEVHYFDHHYHKGLDWYKHHFPTISKLRKTHSKAITGEASPYYISHPLAAQRIKALLPNVKLIVLLRNPIDRALSNYQHIKRLKLEQEPFEKAIKLEEARINGEVDKIIQNPNYYSFTHKHFSYLTRGIYHKELEVWFKEFPASQICIFNSEQFYSDPASVLEKTLKFLNVDPWLPTNFKKFNSGGEYEPISEELRNELIRFYEPHNKKLFELINQEYNWK